MPKRTTSNAVAPAVVFRFVGSFRGKKVFASAEQEAIKEGNAGITLEEWVKAFSVMDVDGDGILTRKEFLLQHGDTEVFDNIRRSKLPHITQKDWQESFCLVFGQNMMHSSTMLKQGTIILENGLTRQDTIVRQDTSRSFGKNAHAAAGQPVPRAPQSEVALDKPIPYLPQPQWMEAVHPAGEAQGPLTVVLLQGRMDIPTMGGTGLMMV